MPTAPRDVAQIRLDNALRLFDEFVVATVRNADAATLRGLERRFAERLHIQPSYWSQIKSRSRQIGERLARQFELCCNKPAFWMDRDHGSLSASGVASGMASGPTYGPASGAPANPVARTPFAALAQEETGFSAPQDDDERFIIGLVLTYYRRHPQRARTRLLDLLGEVLTPTESPHAGRTPAAGTTIGTTAGTATGKTPSTTASPARAASTPRPAPPPDDAWRKAAASVAPLKPKLKK